MRQLKQMGVLIHTIKIVFVNKCSHAKILTSFFFSAMLTSVFWNFYANRGSGAAFGFIADECNFKTVER